ncbi:hypothetical protein NIES4071_70240 [Calothrix sp. NIES-4071]|nr:hypothetical protein NIES4071_70240 [Calothrix sp. NIES-4071]BAZ61299.1 hypothetical protein NIES4105_70190 [Calothrix sp. NIES-4105]
MNIDYRLSIALVLAFSLCVMIPKSLQIMASDRFCPIAEESTLKSIYYSQNFALEIQ